MDYKASSSSGPLRPADGFTLVEALLVIGVLAILLALLLPAMFKARDSANTVKCVGNLKQIGAGLMAYVSDHDGALIPAAVLKTNDYWFDELNRYMGYPSYGPNYVYPGSSSVGQGFPLPWQLCPTRKMQPVARQAVAYGWNYINFGYTASNANNNSHSRLQQVSDPARTIIIGDSKDADASPNNDFQFRYIYERDGPVLPGRHQGRANYLMLDGHVEAFAPGDLPKNHPFWKKFK